MWRTLQPNESATPRKLRRRRSDGTNLPRLAKGRGAVLLRLCANDAVLRLPLLAFQLLGCPLVRINPSAAEYKQPRKNSLVTCAIPLLANFRRKDRARGAQKPCRSKSKWVHRRSPF